MEELPGESSHPQRNSDADNIDDYYVRKRAVETFLILGRLARYF